MRLLMLVKRRETVGVTRLLLQTNDDSTSMYSTALLQARYMDVDNANFFSQKILKTSGKMLGRVQFMVRNEHNRTY